MSQETGVAVVAPAAVQTAQEQKPTKRAQEMVDTIMGKAREVFGSRKAEKAGPLGPGDVSMDHLPNAKEIDEMEAKSKQKLGAFEQEVAKKLTDFTKFEDEIGRSFAVTAKAVYRQGVVLHDMKATCKHYKQPWEKFCKARLPISVVTADQRIAFAMYVLKHPDPAEKERLLGMRPTLAMEMLGIRTPQPRKKDGGAQAAKDKAANPKTVVKLHNYSCTFNSWARPSFGEKMAEHCQEHPEGFAVTFRPAGGSKAAAGRPKVKKGQVLAEQLVNQGRFDK